MPEPVDQPKPNAPGQEKGTGEKERTPRKPRIKKPGPPPPEATQLAADVAAADPGQEMRALAGNTEPQIVVDPSSQTIPDRMKWRAHEQGSGLVLDRKWSDADREHLEKSKAEITAASEMAPRPENGPHNALVLGPGPAHDIPLEQLARDFDEVTLVDLDGERIQQAVDALPEELRGKCKIIIGDVTGGFFTDYPKAIQDAAATATTIEDFLAKATAITNGGLEPHVASFGDPQSFSFVCSQLVMSQLPAFLSDYLTTFMRSREFITHFPGMITNDFRFYIDDPRMEPFQRAFIEHLRPLLTQSHVQTTLDAVPPGGIVYLSDTTSLVQTTRLGYRGPIVQTDFERPMHNRYGADKPIPTSFDVVSYTEDPWIYRSSTPSLDGSVPGTDFRVSATTLRKN